MNLNVLPPFPFLILCFLIQMLWRVFIEVKKILNVKLSSASLNYRHFVIKQIHKCQNQISKMYFDSINSVPVKFSNSVEWCVCVFFFNLLDTHTHADTCARTHTIRVFSGMRCQGQSAKWSSRIWDMPRHNKGSQISFFLNKNFYWRCLWSGFVRSLCTMNQK